MKPPNFYAANGLDRAGHRRSDAAWLAEQMAHPRTLFVPVWRGQSLVLPNGGQPAAALLSRDALLSLTGDDTVLLGLGEERAYFAVDLSAHEAPLEVMERAALPADPVEFTDLRRVGPLLARAEGALLAYARGIMHWHGRHRFCGLCGSATRSEQGGHVRRCVDPGCNTTHFPRTDPAVIMLVTDGERALLGRQAVWAKGQHSTLAGFVEPGESLEEAVAREVEEETGIIVEDVIYHSSQPWPFPASIMLGFYARAVSREIEVDTSELEAARWFERDFILSHKEDDEFRLPRRDSIARRLIEDWLKR
jgi:NAD+ diphosphatase